MRFILIGNEFGAGQPGTHRPRRGNEYIHVLLAREEFQKHSNIFQANIKLAPVDYRVSPSSALSEFIDSLTFVLS